MCTDNMNDASRIVYAYPCEGIRHNLAKEQDHKSACEEQRFGINLHRLYRDALCLIDRRMGSKCFCVCQLSNMPQRRYAPNHLALPPLDVLAVPLFPQLPDLLTPARPV